MDEAVVNTLTRTPRDKTRQPTESSSSGLAVRIASCPLSARRCCPSRRSRPEKQTCAVTLARARRPTAPAWHRHTHTSTACRQRRTTHSCQCAYRLAQSGEHECCEKRSQHAHLIFVFGWEEDLFFSRGFQRLTFGARGQGDERQLQYREQ